MYGSCVCVLASILINNNRIEMVNNSNKYNHANSNAHHFGLDVEASEAQVEVAADALHALKGERAAQVLGVRLGRGQAEAVAVHDGQALARRRLAYHAHRHVHDIATGVTAFATIVHAEQILGAHDSRTRTAATVGRREVVVEYLVDQVVRNAAAAIPYADHEVLLVDGYGDVHVGQIRRRIVPIARCMFLMVVVFACGAEGVLEQLGHNVLERQRQVGKLGARVSVYLDLGRHAVPVQAEARDHARRRLDEPFGRELAVHDAHQRRIVLHCNSWRCCRR